MTPAELKQRRQSLGMTQQQLADALGITPNRLQSWEVGRNAIPPFLHLALDALGTRQPQVDEMLTTEQAADLLGRRPSAVRHAISAGKIPATLVSGGGRRSHYLVSRAAVGFYNQYQKRRGHGGNEVMAPPRGKLTETDARAILAAKGVRSVTALTADYGVSRNTIYQIWNGNTWSHLQPPAPATEEQ